MKLIKRLPATATDFERNALPAPLNFSDGHAQQSLPGYLQPLVDQMPELFRGTRILDQTRLESEFLSNFFAISNQQTLVNMDAPALLTYSASSTMDLVSKFCMRRNCEVHVLHPCFDNIVSLLRNHHVPIVPVEEDLITDFDAASMPSSCKILWLVCPNNPTGVTPSEEDFRGLVQWAAESDVLLIFDFCFRLFSPEMRSWDQYSHLYDSKVSFICIEDTGKVFPLLDLKAGICICSDENFEELESLHNDLLLNVSPFILRLNSEAIRLTQIAGLDSLFCDLNANRKLVENFLSESSFQIASPHMKNVPFAWLETHVDQAATFLIERNLHVLSGSLFYWASPDQGGSIIRMPLSRGGEMMAQGLELLREFEQSVI